MEPTLFSSLPYPLNIAALVVFLQAGIVLFATSRRHLKWVSLAFTAVIGSQIGENGAAMVPAHFGWVLVVAGLVGGALLGYLVRPAGIGLVLAYLGEVIVTHYVSIPFIQIVVAVDLFAYGLFLTDLAPTLVSGLLASSIFLLSILWLGVSAPAALVLASGAGLARFMASSLPSRLASRSLHTRIPGRN